MEVRSTGFLPRILTTTDTRCKAPFPWPFLPRCLVWSVVMRMRRIAAAVKTIIDNKNYWWLFFFHQMNRWLNFLVFCGWPTAWCSTISKLERGVTHGYLLSLERNFNAVVMTQQRRRRKKKRLACQTMSFASSRARSWHHFFSNFLDEEEACGQKYFLLSPISPLRRPIRTYIHTNSCKPWQMYKAKHTFFYE